MIAYQHSPSETLAERLRRQRLTIAESLRFIECVADHLAELHARGLVHTELEPSTILLCDGRLDRLILLEAGQRKSERVRRVTIYSAPEALRGEELDPRADVYALGCILYECVTGQPCFPPSCAEAPAKLLFHPTPRMSDVLASAPRAVDELVEWMMAKDRALRPPDGAAAALEIRACATESAAPEIADEVEPDPRDNTPLVTPTPVTLAASVTTTAHDTEVEFTTPAVTLLLDEIARNRIWLKVAFCIAVCIAAAVPLMTGDHALKIAVLVGVSCVMPVTAYLYWDLRHPENYTASRIFFGCIVCITASYFGVLYFGLFSPAPCVFVLGIYYFSLNNSRIGTAIIYAVCSLLQAVGAAFLTVGVIPDFGIVKAARLTVSDQIMLQVLVQLIFVCAYVMARLSRQNTLEHIRRLEYAVRRVAQRDALLGEARADLERALRVGGPGRLTDHVLGHYRLGNMIGRGAMGEVYEASHNEHGGLAAVKIMHRDVVSDRASVDRFLREMAAAASIDCPHVVRVLEAGKTTGGVPYLVMERLRGHDLAHHLRQVSRMSIENIAAMVEQVGQGLAAAQCAGIVHRDIKPQNVWFAPSDRPCSEKLEGQGGLARSLGAWKILDFGISKLGDSRGTLTQGGVVGTPAYMAPEQARGQHVDHRADLYSLGVIVYRALTGQPAFADGDPHSMLYEVVHEMPSRPSLLSSLSPQVDLVLAIALAKNREQRFNSGDEFAAALRSAAAGALDVEMQKRAEDILGQTPWRANG